MLRLRICLVVLRVEGNEVADCISRNSLAARLARITKQVGAHSAITTVAQEQQLARKISSQSEAREQVEQRHAEFTYNPQTDKMVYGMEIGERCQDFDTKLPRTLIPF